MPSIFISLSNDKIRLTAHSYESSRSVEINIERMALRAGKRCPLTLTPRGRAAIGWGGVLVVGLAAVGWRSMSGHVLRGDTRARYWAHFGQSARHWFSTSISQNRLFFPSSSPFYSDMTITPPQAAPQWNHSGEDIQKSTKVAIETYRKVLESVGGLDRKDCTFESVGTYISCIFSLHSRIFL